jgi:PAS domain S-box-containing protein
MQVKQRLKINAAILVITALIVFLILSLALYRINKANNAAKIAGDMVLNAFERVTLRNDYLRNNNERAKVQWFAVYEEIGRILKSASKEFHTSEDKKTIDELLENHESIGKIFSAMVENREKTKSNANSAVISQEIENRLLNQLNMKIYLNVTYGRELEESSRKARASIIWQTGVSIACSFLFLLAAGIIHSWTMGRTITERIRMLRDGASLIGGGDLDYRIDVKGDDEFAELSDAFNAMAAQLRGSYHDLEKEVEEHKRAEEALRESETQFRELFENMIDGFAYCKMVFENGKPQDFIYLSVNHAFETLTGLKNVVGKRVTEIIPGIRETDPELFEIYGRVSLTGKNERFEMFVEVLKMWLSISVYSPKKEFFVAVFDNITERKKAEEVEGHLAAIVESAEDAIIGKDLNGIIQTWNVGAENIFGYKAEEVIGKPISLLVPPGHTDEVPEILERIEQGEHIDNFETVRMRKDGTIIPVSLTFSAIKDTSGRIIGASKIAHDITERKKAEELIATLNEKLKRNVDELSFTNKELEAFSYSVSHDLRAPLRSMDGFSQAILEDYGDKLDEKGRDALRRIRAASQRMGLLIDDLLNLSRISRREVDRRKVDLSALAHDIVGNLQKTQPGREVEINIAEGLIDEGDKRLLYVLLQNLLGNAWKFTEKRAKARVEFGVSQVDGRPAYFVRDNGAGFDMAYVDKLFRPFQRLHDLTDFSGTGIGLATVQRIIHRHGGQVWAEGKVEKGATFYFTLK